GADLAADGRGRDLPDPRVVARLGSPTPAGGDPDPDGPGEPTRSRRVPPGDPPGSIRGPPGPGESPRPRLPAVSAVLEPAGPQARRAHRDLLGDRADGPPADLQPQSGEHRPGDPDRRADGGPARQPGAAGHPGDPAGRGGV